MSEKICEICKNLIEENDETVSCPDCGREFHKKCWRITGKCCVNEECRQKAHERKEAEKQNKEKTLAEQKAETEKSVKLCSKCGKELNDEEEFCGKCGTPVTKEIDEKPKERICSKCGRILKDEEIFCCKCGTEYTEILEPTKTDKKPIYKKKWFVISAACVCVVALVTIIAAVVSANQVEPCTYHSWETVKIIKEATCTENGLEKRKCSVCGEKEEQKIPLKEHQWKNNTVKEATCTEEGREEKVCSICGEKENNTIPANGHNWIEASCTKPRTCSVCGKTEGNKLEHDFNTDGVCIYCGKENTREISTNGLTFIIPKDTVTVSCCETQTSVKINSVSWYESTNSLILNYDTECIYQEGGTCNWFEYSIIDEDGYVIDSQTVMAMDLNTGEKCRNQIETINISLKKGKTYKLKIFYS